MVACLCWGGCRGAEGAIAEVEEEFSQAEKERFLRARGLGGTLAVVDVDDVREMAGGYLIEIEGDVFRLPEGREVEVDVLASERPMPSQVLLSYPSGDTCGTSVSPPERLMCVEFAYQPSPLLANGQRWLMSLARIENTTGAIFAPAAGRALRSAEVPEHVLAEAMGWLRQVGTTGGGP
jgi:hypothetical protein